MSLFNLPVFAENKTPKYEVNIGTGKFSTFRINAYFEQRPVRIFDLASYSYSKIRTTNPLSVGFEYSFNKHHSLVLDYCYEELQYEVYKSNFIGVIFGPTPVKQIKYKGRSFDSMTSDIYRSSSLLLGYKRTYLKKKWLQLYSSLQLGISLKKHKRNYDNTQAEYSEINNTYTQAAYHLCPFGIRLGKKLGVTFELPGIGYRGLLNVGLSQKF